MRITMRIGHSLMTPTSPGDGVLVTQELGPHVTSLSWSWDARGPAAATVGMSRPGRSPVVGILPADMAIPEQAHVELWAGTTLLWDGFVAEVERGQGGVITALSLAGYMASLDDIEWDYTGYGAATSGRLMLERMLTERAPWLGPDTSGRWIDPLVTLGTLDSYQGQMVGQIVETIRNAGDVATNLLWLLARPGRSVVLEPRIAPTEPHYRTAFDPQRITRWRELHGETARAVRVRYGTTASPAATALAGNPDSGSYRVVTVQAGDIGAAAAVALRDVELARRAQPRVAATLGASRDVRTWLAASGGQPVPWWQPVVSEWVAVAGYPPLPIVATTMDGIAETATYELGERDLTLAQNRGLVQRQMSYRYQTMTAPAGGRLR